MDTLQCAASPVIQIPPPLSPRTVLAFQNRQRSPSPRSLSPQRPGSPAIPISHPLSPNTLLAWQNRQRSPPPRSPLHDPLHHSLHQLNPHLPPDPPLHHPQSPLSTPEITVSQQIPIPLSTPISHVNTTTKFNPPQIQILNLKIPTLKIFLMKILASLLIDHHPDPW